MSKNEFKIIDVHQLRGTLREGSGVVDLALKQVRNLIAAIESMKEGERLNVERVGRALDTYSQEKTSTDEQRYAIAELLNTKIDEIRQPIIDADLHPALLHEITQINLWDSGLVWNYPHSVCSVLSDVRSYLDPTRPPELHAKLEENLRKELRGLPTYQEYCKQEIQRIVRNTQRMDRNAVIEESDIEQATDFLLTKAEPQVLNNLNEIIENLHGLAGGENLDEDTLRSALIKLHAIVQEGGGKTPEEHVNQSISPKNIERVRELNEEFCRETPEEYNQLIADAKFTSRSQTAFSEAAKFWYEYGEDSENWKFMQPLIQGKTFIDLGCSHSRHPRIASKKLGAARYIGVDRFRHTPGSTPHDLVLEEMVYDYDRNAYFLRNRIGRTSIEEKEGSESIWVEDDMLGFISKIKKEGGYVFYVSGVEREDDLQRKDRAYYERVTDDYLAALWKEVGRVTKKSDVVIVGKMFGMSADLLLQYGFKPLFEEVPFAEMYRHPLSSIRNRYKIFQKY